MKESISIKNLGPLKDIYIDDIKPFTVFIGESGSGKSTLMKVVALFRWIYKMHNIESYLKHSQPGTRHYEYEIDDYFNSSGIDQFVKSNTEIEYKSFMPSGETYRIKYANQSLTGISQQELIRVEDISFNKISFISETRNIIPLWATKGASLPNNDLGFYFNEVYRDFNLATENTKELTMDFLALKFSVKKTKEGKEYFVQSNSGPGDTDNTNDSYQIDFKNSSSGTQTSIPVSLLAQYFSQSFDFTEAFNRSVLQSHLKAGSLIDFKPIKNLDALLRTVYIHIEEPELSLYPDAQCELINDVVKKCFLQNEHKVGLILSTHSPYIINHLNLLIKAFDTGHKINGANFNYDDLAVFQISDGSLLDLKVQNHRLIFTDPLSETINAIYDQYNSLEKNGNIIKT
jgi:predicted ATPase